ncbi:hypothetical protein TNCV_3082341 [Trichonephila clavipes]|nr:hypothetical protein TNCV_3082341 [Trichonephila clavipes]
MGTVEATLGHLTLPGGDPLSHHFAVYLTQRELSAHSHRCGSTFLASVALPSSQRFQRPPHFLGLSEKRQPMQHYQKSNLRQIRKLLPKPTLWPQLRIHHRLRSDEKYSLAQPWNRSQS